MAPPLKHRKLDVPYHVERAEKRKRQLDDLAAALRDIEKVIFHLALVVHNGQNFTDASQRAAESHGFASGWGGRQLHSWTQAWVNSRELPKSRCGCHTKVYSLLSDPDIAGECRTYLRSNKWAVNPEKLAQFTSGKLIHSAASKYLQHMVDEEMPKGLKKYLELELFPCIHMKVARGVSLSTASQANNDADKTWVCGDEHRLKKKGVGWGIQQSDVICSTVGYLTEASESLEYGKNHVGYWTGEHFIKQLHEKIIPAFEHAHGAGYQALFLIDNSQGHSAYAEDALLVWRMNVNPGGKQAHLRNGWYIHDGQTVSQSMVYPNDHPQFPNQPKGIKAYLRDNCDYTFDTLKKNMPLALASVSINTIRLWQHRMFQWMEAYRSGLTTRDAQLRVKQFSSARYKSHRRVPETVARFFDHV
ncbi:hypothetical protein EDB19DRAFT_1897638 [Suillus lakei]|nr:hypothetical protein EDB19DRAFT_1897638 [Suillus lakei]